MSRRPTAEPGSAPGAEGPVRIHPSWPPTPLTRRAWLAGAAALLALSEPRAFAAAGPEASGWIVAGRPGPLADQALQLLAQAGGHGLDPSDYGLATLQQAVERARRGPPWPADALARLQSALTAALTVCLSDLSAGRVSPSALSYRFQPARDARPDASTALRFAADAGELGRAVRAMQPAVPQYERLRQALASIRERIGDPAWRDELPRLPAGRGAQAGKVEPGQSWQGLPVVAARLAAWRDLATLPPTSARLDGPLLQALRAFQQRHGLLDDGVIGRSTWAALQVTPAQRARQLELALERLRWTPLRQGRRVVVVNLPEFVLRGYEVQADGRIEVRLEMKVIVGRASVTRTPVFEAAMRLIEFQPFWNVPPSIARGEVVPRLRRDPAYWDREGFEFVDGRGQPDPQLATDKLQAVLEGRLRIRQRPGPRNALGDIKFVFPNQDHIYLHHTPSTQLFERTRRDFSHGCIRVEQPVALARFVLDGLPGWDEARIRAAMEQGMPSTLGLPEPVPVLIAYGTALVKQGRVHFFEDLYGHDRKLDAALRERPRPVIPGLREGLK